MENKKGTRYGNDRTALQDVIPLATPYLLFVDPSSACNFKCKFCPCGGANKDVWDENKKVNIMPYEIYRKVIDDLTEFPDKLKTLRLYKEGEPLLNKRLPDMVNYARKKNVARSIDFTTNASLLKKDLILALTDAGLDRINISIEALDAEGYKNISGVDIDFEEFKKNLEFLYKNKNGCHIFMKISDVGLGDHPENDFYNMFGEMCDEISVEHITPVWPDFDLKGDLHNEKSLDIYGSKMANRTTAQVCPYLFYSLCVNSDGTVSACLMDWNHQLIVGDLKKESLIDIWNGPKMQEMRINHLKLNKSIYKPCSKCGQLEYAVLDNIDAYSTDLLRKILG